MQDFSVRQAKVLSIKPRDKDRVHAIIGKTKSEEDIYVICPTDCNVQAGDTITYTPLTNFSGQYNGKVATESKAIVREIPLSELGARQYGKGLGIAPAPGCHIGLWGS